MTYEQRVNKLIAKRYQTLGLQAANQNDLASNSGLRYDKPIDSNFNRDDARRDRAREEAALFAYAFKLGR